MYFYKAEDGLDNVHKIIWRNKLYIVGNRRHNLVELYQNKKLIRTVTISSCKTANPLPHLMA